MKSYSELIRYSSFDDRFNYLQLHGAVGVETFASYRYLNQRFYTSREWKLFRRDIILRDCGCDLGVPGYEIHGPIILHHIQPLTMDQIIEMDYALMDPDNTIATSLATHNAIHYGTQSPYPALVVRQPGDTTLWTKKVLDG